MSLNKRYESFKRQGGMNWSNVKKIPGKMRTKKNV